MSSNSASATASVAGLGVDDAAARQQQRPLRLRQERRRALDGLRDRPRGAQSTAR